MDQFTFTGDSPALYYAQSAWEFKHGNADRGNDWITSAQKIYSPALNLVFADSLYDIGWLKRSGEEDTADRGHPRAGGGATSHGTETSHAVSAWPGATWDDGRRWNNGKSADGPHDPSGAKQSADLLRFPPHSQRRSWLHRRRALHGQTQRLQNCLRLRSPNHLFRMGAASANRSGGDRARQDPPMVTAGFRRDVG